MEVFNIKNMKKGWFIGNFSPAVLKTERFEVGLHEYKKDNPTCNHYHKKSTEINVIIEGKMIVNNQTLSAGDIFCFDPYVVSECTFLEDTKLIAVRDSSFPNDKYSAE